MKRLITIIITLLILLGLSYAVTYYTHTKFIDFSFFVGLVVTVIVWFFTSKGGFTSRNAEMMIQSQTGIKLEKQKYEFSPNVVFFTSLAYTLISLVTMLYQYRSYF
jgi:amino acid transporter